MKTLRVCLSIIALPFLFALATTMHIFPINVLVFIPEFFGLLFRYVFKPESRKQFKNDASEAFSMLFFYYTITCGPCIDWAFDKEIFFKKSEASW